VTADDAIRDLRDEDGSEFVQAVCALALDGSEPDADYFTEPHATELREMDQAAARRWCAEAIVLRARLEDT
jgi:hypothetical protein